MAFGPPSLTPAKAVPETGRTLVVFQGSDTLGSVSNVQLDYPKSADKQGHERKQQRVPAWTTDGRRIHLPPPSEKPSPVK